MDKGGNGAQTPVVLGDNLDVNTDVMMLKRAVAARRRRNSRKNSESVDAGGIGVVSETTATTSTFYPKIT
jgi:hypothetical protein